VYWLELFIQVPLCLVVIWLYAKRSPARPVVEAFLCALHFAGTWAYYLPSIIMGETNNVIISNIDRTVATAWVIVPGLLAWRAMKQVVEATKANAALPPTCQRPGRPPAGRGRRGRRGPRGALQGARPSRPGQDPPHPDP
jgi:hypothetical protein